MTHFTPFASLLGGMLIGLAATLLLAASGRVAGISGIVAGIFVAPDARAWRCFFVAGLVGAGVVLLVVRPASFAATGVASLPVLAAAGVLVGVGTRVGGGCTSGHGVCGLSRLSARSLVATLVFMTTGAATVFVARHLLGAGQ